jgi:hypothetical protein
MSNLKRIIEEDIDELIPTGYYDKILKEVMHSIEAPQKSLLVSFLEKKDNIVLFFTVIFCICLIYFFGYNDTYKLHIYVSKDLIFSFLSKFIPMLIIIIFLINDYFDRKKKILI